jgi:hypothetical protein
LRNREKIISPISFDKGAAIIGKAPYLQAEFGLGRHFKGIRAFYGFPFL